METISKQILIDKEDKVKLKEMANTKGCSENAIIRMLLREEFSRFKQSGVIV